MELVRSLQRARPLHAAPKVVPVPQTGCLGANLVRPPLVSRAEGRLARFPCAPVSSAAGVLCAISCWCCFGVSLRAPVRHFERPNETTFLPIELN